MAANGTPTRYNTLRMANSRPMRMERRSLLPRNRRPANYSGACGWVKAKIAANGGGRGWDSVPAAWTGQLRRLGWRRRLGLRLLFRGWLQFGRVRPTSVHFGGALRGLVGGVGRGHAGRAVRRLHLQLHLKDQRTDLHLIAMHELALLVEQGAVDQGAVAAAQVADESAGGRHAQQAVLAAHPFAFRADVALRPAAEIVIAAGKQQAFAQGSSLDHQQLHGHALLPTPQNPAPPP